MIASRRRCTSVLLDLGTSQIRAGDRTAARLTFDRAVRTCRACDGAEWLGKVALALAPGPFTMDFGGYDEDMVRLLEEAITLVGSGDGAPALRGLLLAQLASTSYWRTPLPYRSRLTAKAAELVATENASVRARVTATCLVGTWTPENLQERIAVATPLVRLAENAGEHEVAQLARLLLASSLLERGDMYGTRRELAAFQEANRTYRLPQVAWMSLATQAMLSLLDARLEDVEALSLECHEMGMRIRDRNALQAFGALLMFVRLEQDRCEEFIPDLEGIRTSFPLMRGWDSLLALALARSGRVHEAKRLLSSLADAGFPFERDIVWLPAVVLAAETAAILRHESAEHLYQMLVPFRDRIVVVGFGTACLGSVHRYLGLLARAAGRDAVSRGHFEDALGVHEGLGSTLLVARSRYELAAVLFEDGDAIVLERAASLAAAARATAQRHGLHQLLRALEPVSSAGAEKATLTGGFT